MKKSKIKRNLKYFRQHQKVLDNLLTAFEWNGYEYAIVGGFVRRSLMKTPDAFIGFKDFDIIVDISTSELKHILSHFRFKYDQNSNGGFKVKEWEQSKFKDMSIDVWTLKDHIPFERETGLPKTFEGVSKGAPISTDSGVYVPGKNKLYAYKHYLFETIKTGEIQVIYEPGYQDAPKIAARLKYLKNYYGWKLDDNSVHLVQKYFNSQNPSIRKKTTKYYKHLIEG